MRASRGIFSLDVVRRRLRLWLGIFALSRRVRNLEEWRDTMALTREDIERLQAVTSRIAARVASLLDKIDELGTGNDDEVRAAAKLEAAQEASAELRPFVDQLEALGSDATNPIPEPAPDQAPVEPGPDVTPPENLDTVTEPAPDAGDQGTSQPGPGEPVVTEGTTDAAGGSSEPR